MSQDVIQLTDDQKAVTTPSISRIKQYQSLINETAVSIQPVVVMFCKMHNVNPDEYVLSEDGTALVSRAALQRAQVAPAPAPQPEVVTEEPKPRLTRKSN